MSQVQVTFIGARSFFNKICCFLLKQSKHIKRLDIYDDEKIKLGLDLAKMTTNCKVRCYRGREHLPYAVRNADIIVIGENYLDVPINSDIVFSAVGKDLIEYASIISQYAPKALVVVATSPINSTLPLVSFVMEACGCCDCNRIMGVTSHDSMRANSILAHYLQISPHCAVLPVIGGSSPETRVPLFSQAKPCTAFKKHVMRALSTEIKTREEEIIRRNKYCEVSNRAYGLVKFLHSVIGGLQEKCNVIDIALTRSVLIPGTEFFSMPLLFGKKGIEYRFGLPRMNSFEIMMLECALESICKDIDRAEFFFKNRDACPKADESYSDFLGKFKPKGGKKEKDEYTIFGKKVKLGTHLVGDVSPPPCEPKYLPEECECDDSYPIYNPPPIPPRHMPPHSPYSAWLKTSGPKVCTELFEMKKPCAKLPEACLPSHSPCDAPFRVTFEEHIACQEPPRSQDPPNGKYDNFTVMSDTKHPSPMLTEESPFTPIQIPLYVCPGAKVPSKFPPCSSPYPTPCPHQSAPAETPPVNPPATPPPPTLPRTVTAGPSLASPPQQPPPGKEHIDTKQVVSLEMSSPSPSFNLFSWINSFIIKLSFVKQAIFNRRHSEDLQLSEYFAALKAKENKKSEQLKKTQYSTLAFHKPPNDMEPKEQVGTTTPSNEVEANKKPYTTQLFKGAPQHTQNNTNSKRTISYEARVLTPEEASFARNELHMLPQPQASNLKPPQPLRNNVAMAKRGVSEGEHDSSVLLFDSDSTRVPSTNESLGQCALPSFVGFEWIDKKKKITVKNPNRAAIIKGAIKQSHNDLCGKTHLSPHCQEERLNQLRCLPYQANIIPESLYEAKAESAPKSPREKQWQMMERVLKEIHRGSDPASSLLLKKPTPLKSEDGTSRTSTRQRATLENHAQSPHRVEHLYSWLMSTKRNGGLESK